MTQKGHETPLGSHAYGCEPSARMQKNKKNQNKKQTNTGDPHTHRNFLLSFCKYDLLTPYGVQNTLRLSRLTGGVINENQAFVVVTHNF